MSTELSQIITELPGNIPRDVLNELIRGFEAESVFALKQQREIAQANTYIERKSVDGLGEVTMAIAPNIFHFWGQKLGYECWQNKRFREEFRKKHPEVRVKSRSAKPRISMAGLGL